MPSPRKQGPITTDLNCLSKPLAIVPKPEAPAYWAPLSRGRLVVGTTRDALLIPRIEIVARRHRCRGHAVGARTMRPPPPSRETLALTGVEAAGAAADLRLRSGDERRQA